MDTRDLNREIRQRSHALAIGALVRPPRTMEELVQEESANTSEIDMLSSRRHLAWSAILHEESTQVRADIRYDKARIREGLDTAFAAKRKLHLVRELMTDSRGRYR